MSTTTTAAEVLGINAQQQERSVLGGMMLSRQIIWEVLDVLQAGDFADWRNESVFRALASLAHANEPTDVMAVTGRMQRDGDLERVGGAAELHMMCGEVPTASNAPYYAGLVKQAAIKRRLVEAGAAIAHMGVADGDAFELAESARAAVDLAADTARVEVLPVGDGVDDVLESFRSRPRYVESPWANIDRLINGFRPGALYVIGARPGSGKTIMGLQAAVQLATRGNVAFSSLEMDTADLTKRLFSMQGSVHMSNITKSDLSPEEWESIARVRPFVGSLPLFIDDRSGVNITQIKAFARSVSRRGKLTAVVVDYLQLIVGTDSRKPRHETVAEISRQLKIMARELDVVVIALSQLNRESEQRAGGVRRLPTLSDLRESGSIEQDADVVMLLQRGETVDPMTDEALPNDELEIVIAKNRHGSTGKVSLLWEGHFARVTTMPWT